MNLCWSRRKDDGDLYLSQLGEELYELKQKRQEGGMALRVTVTCNIFDLEHVALDLPVSQPQEAMGIML